MCTRCNIFVFGSVNAFARGNMIEHGTLVVATAVSSAVRRRVPVTFDCKKGTFITPNTARRRHLLASQHPLPIGLAGDELLVEIIHSIIICTSKTCLRLSLRFKCWILPHPVLIVGWLNTGGREYN